VTTYCTPTIYTPLDQFEQSADPPQSQLVVPGGCLPCWVAIRHTEVSYDLSNETKHLTLVVVLFLVASRATKVTVHRKAPHMMARVSVVSVSLHKDDSSHTAVRNDYVDEGEVMR
jgi:hypothetical protein